MQGNAKNPNSLFPLLLLSAICIISHADILSHSFMIDDSFFQNEKETLKLYPHFIDFFTQNHSTHYIPFNFLLNVSLFHIFKQALPLYLINLILFYIDCILLFNFISLISKNTTIALLTSAIFCIHPMSAEILQHITFNIILIQFALILTSLIYLYKYFHEDEQHISYYIASLLAFSFALLCQENSLLFPLYAVATLFFLTKASPAKIIKIVLPYIFLCLLLIALWIKTAGHTAHLMQSIQSFNLTFWEWNTNFSQMIAWYLTNLFVPQNINFEYNLTPAAHLSWAWDIASWGILAGCILLIFCYFKKNIESLALVYFLAGFLYAIPASLAHPDVGLVFEPHWLFFSSIGFYLFAALMLLKLKNHVRRLLYLSLLTSILMYLFIYTEKNHTTARNELSYCENWLRKSPHNSYAMLLLTKYYCFGKGIDVPSDLIPDMINNVDFLINNNYYISAPLLIKKLSTYDLSPAQRRELIIKSEAFHHKYE